MLDAKNLTNLKQNVDMTKQLYTSQVETSLQFSLSWTQTVSLELGRSCFWILQCEWSFLLWTFGLFSCVTIKTFIQFLCFYISEDSVLQSLKSNSLSNIKLIISDKTNTHAPVFCILLSKGCPKKNYALFLPNAEILNPDFTIPKLKMLILKTILQLNA